MKPPQIDLLLKKNLFTKPIRLQIMRAFIFLSRKGKGFFSMFIECVEKKNLND